MPSRFPLADVRLALRADRAELIGHLRSSGIECRVGPSERDDWVVVMLDDAADPAPLARELCATISPVVLTTVIDTTGRRLELRAWRRHLPQPVHDLHEIASAIGVPAASVPAVDDPDEPGALAADRLERIAARLRLPRRLVDPVTTSALVVHRGRLQDAHMVAALAGPAWVASASGWRVLVPTEPPGPTGRMSATASGLAAGLSTGKRQPTTVLLWREGHDGCGYLLWRKGRPVDGHQWNSPWQPIPERGPDDEHGDVDLLVRAAGKPEHTVLLRALLRRAGGPTELFEEFADLTGIPGEAFDVLLGRRSAGRLPAAELVERRSFGSVLGSSFRSPLSGAAATPVAIGAAVAALVFTVLAVVGVAVVASNGAFVDQHGRTSGDWLFAMFSTVMAIGTTWLAVSRARAVNRPAHEDSPAGSKGSG